MKRSIGTGKCLLTAACLLFIGALQASAAGLIKVPLAADHWRVIAPSRGDAKADVKFMRQEGFPQGILAIKAGSASLNGLSFRNGTIEFDMKGIGEDIPGIQFRRQGDAPTQNAEEFYVRTFPDCRASNDCIQYSPVINGFLLWNVYPQYQTQAFILDGWNHIKLVVSGRRMNVYINRDAKPTLVVGGLEGSSAEGGIELRGPALYANLTVTPDAVEGLSPLPLPDPLGADRGVVRQWQLGPLTPAHFGTAPAYAELPPISSGWQSVAAGRFGLVNLNRNFPFTLKPPSLSWLRTTVISDRDQQKHVQMGWLGGAWVFVNGKLVTQGKNYYDPENERRDPDGRLDLANGGFNIPLQRGANEIVVAIYASIHDDGHTENRYGWGLEMRFDDSRGLTLAR